MLKKLMSIMIGLIVVTALVGCVRTTAYLKERVDREVGGNRGYLQGSPPPAQEREVASTRTMINIEIELPPYVEWERYEWSDEDLWGNRGFLLGGPPERKIQAKKEIKKEEEIERGAVVEELEKELKKEEALPLNYTVKEGETLQDIAAEIYGSTKKWTIIYRANRDKIEKPDQIYPGQVLRIPEVKYSK